MPQVLSALVAVLPFLAPTGLAAAGRVPVAYDMMTGDGSSSSLKLLSYTNPYTDAFSSIHDAFQKHSRGTTNPPAVLLDDSISTNGADTIGIIPEDDTDIFFGIADTVNSQNPSGGPVSATWSFDISGESDLQFAIDAAAMGDFEGSTATDPDYFVWSAQIDDGIVQELLFGATDTSASQLYTMADGTTRTINDPIKIRGIPLTNEFQTFTSLVSGTGNVLTVTLEAVASNDKEATAFRNLQILADDGSGSSPAPTPFQSCPEKKCTSNGVTTTNPGDSGCSSTSGPAAIVTLGTYVHAESGDVLIELLGPADAAHAANLVISSPHGGDLKPSYIPDRQQDAATPYCPSSGCRVSADGYTKEISELFQQKFTENYCRTPYLIINHLHRSKLDANREENEAAHGDVTALAAWQKFHDLIADAQDRVRTKYGTVTGTTGLTGVKGLLFDMHGYAGTDFDPVDGSPLIQWGYRLGTSTLDPEQWCPVDEKSYGSIGSFTHARFLPDQSLECLVRGPASIPARLPALQKSGLCGAGTPSPDFPSPGAVTDDCAYCSDMCAETPDPCGFYSGGYDINVHERLDWQAVTPAGDYFNTIQAELPRCIRFDAAMHAPFADNLSIAVMSFLRDLYGPEPTMPTAAPVVPPTSAPVNPPTSAHVNLPTAAPVASPTCDTINVKSTCNDAPGCSWSGTKKSGSCGVALDSCGTGARNSQCSSGGDCASCSCKGNGRCA